MKESVWSEGSKYDKVQGRRINQDLAVQAAVIGGGMAGVLSAFLLQEAGWKVIVLEAESIGRGITKNTTAKITIQHHLIYDKLIHCFGMEKAREYAKVNQEALKKYEELVGKYTIDCCLEKQPAFVYTLQETKKIEKEAAAAQKLGIDGIYTNQTDLPFPVKGAVRLGSQLQFNPLSFLDRLSNELTIYEHSRAVEITRDGRILTEGEGERVFEVKAEYIVVATHYPFMNRPGYYFLRMYQERSYVIAVETEKTLSYGMYIDEDKNGFSLRRYKDMILLGGGSHRTGEKPGAPYQKLQRAANEWYPGCPIRFQWSNQDCMTLDGVPYIGAYSASTPRIYVATGFGKWGMSTAMAAALLLRDAIGDNHTNTGIFSPARIKPAASARKLGKNLMTATIRWSLQLFCIPERLAEGMEWGEGKIVRHEGKKIGVYRDETGKLYAVNTKCPHLGCMLAWNQEEKTWDCPCHGSRFDYKGNLLNNPSQVGNAAGGAICCTRQKKD